MAKHGIKKQVDVKLILKRINAQQDASGCGTKSNFNLASWKTDVHSKGLLQSHAHGDCCDNPDHIDEGSKNFLHQGPVAYLVEDLRKCGCTLTEDLSVHCGDTCCFNIRININFRGRSARGWAY